MPRTTRPFNILDAIVLLAAVAAGLAWAREDIAATMWARERPSGTIMGNHMLKRPVTFVDRLFTFRRGAARFLACATAASLLLRLRAPRPHAARLNAPAGGDRGGDGRGVQCRCRGRVRHGILHPRQVQATMVRLRGAGDRRARHGHGDHGRVGHLGTFRALAW